MSTGRLRAELEGQTSGRVRVFSDGQFEDIIYVSRRIAPQLVTQINEPKFNKWPMIMLIPIVAATSAVCLVIVRVFG